MRLRPPDLKTALVLPGGGARGAFQVGVLKALAELLPPRAPNPFPILSGTSAGAVDSVVLASKARRFCLAVAELERVWGHFRCEHVFRTDSLTTLKRSLHWLTAIVSGGLIAGTPRSLLDNAPLRASSTTAACTQRWPCAKTVTRPSWSTATRKPFPPTMTPPIVCTSSR